jgi:2-oxoglutarate ferredoxin oxidoreductase subunit gamma
LRKDIRIAGFGGQGIILAGIVIGKAASLYDNLFAVQTQSYGPEARGGASKTEVVISDSEIDYPKVQKPDIFIAMSNEALMAYLDDLKDGGMLIVDPDMIKEEDILPFIEKHNIDYYKAPVTRTATEKIGLNIVANIVMVGAITKITNVVSEEAARNAIAASVPPGTEEKNIAAFEAGMDLVGEE